MSLAELVSPLKPGKRLHHRSIDACIRWISSKDGFTKESITGSEPSLAGDSQRHVDRRRSLC